MLCYDSHNALQASEDIHKRWNSFTPLHLTLTTLHTRHTNSKTFCIMQVQIQIPRHTPSALQSPENDNFI